MEAILSGYVCRCFCASVNLENLENLEWSFLYVLPLARAWKLLGNPLGTLGSWECTVFEETRTVV
jgi:hypothetical protein